MADGFIVSAPQSGSGKTLTSLGLARAMSDAGLSVVPAKAGPDYIDPSFLRLAARAESINLDAWGMSPKRLQTLATRHADGADILLVEGVMGLFDASAAGFGSTGDLAASLMLPAVLVIDCSRMAQSVAAVAAGFARFRSDVCVSGVILNKVSSARHEAMLRAALDSIGMPCFGAVPKSEALAVPSRHLGLLLAGEVDGVEALVAEAGRVMAASVDLAALRDAARPVGGASAASRLPPLGAHIAIARDQAFAFLYEHWLKDWRAAGASMSFFSPLANEGPEAAADAVFLPGGYPELHAGKLAAAGAFRDSLHAAEARGAIIYGECGGFMAMGAGLTDASGTRHRMAGLLPHETRIDGPKRVLGYRVLRHQGPLPFARQLSGHEFHYSTQTVPPGQNLFTATDALGERLEPMGLVNGKVCGSYAHVIDLAPGL